MNRNTKYTAKTIFFHVIASLIGLLIIIPFLWMISTSLKEKGALLAVPIQWIPEKISFSGYKMIFEFFPFEKAAFNSIFLATSVTLVTLLSASMAAFAFSKIHFRGRENVFRIFLMTMMIPGQVTLIPMFIILQSLGLTNSFSGIIVPTIFNAFAVFMLRQKMMTIPSDYMDAAVIDGANIYMIFFKIIIPMSSATLATLGVITFMGSWNDYFWPLIILSDKNKMTLPLALTQLNGQYSSHYNGLMAGGLLSMLPIIIIYIFAQKYFSTGMQVGGIKG